MNMLRRKKPQPRSILIVLGQTGMGDAVEALPVFDMIRDYWPQVSLAAGYFRETQESILETSPNISRMIRLFGGVRYARRSMKGFLRNLRAMRGSDVALFLYKKEAITLPIRLAARLAGAQVLYRHGYRYRREGRNTYSDFPEYCFFQIAASNLLWDSPLTRVRKPQIALPESDNQFAEEFFNRNGLGRRPTVIINTQSSGTGSLPDWGIQKYAQAANDLVAWGADVIFNGGGEHQVEEFRNVARQLRHEVVMLERPSPRELAAVFGKCDLYLGAGHGAACLAMAVGVPTITLVGPGEHGYPGQERIGPVWWPRGPAHKVISKIDWCRLSARCTCRPDQPKLLKRLMKYLGVWETWRYLRKKLRRTFGIDRRRTVPEVYPPCFEAITVEEVVELAKKQLRSNKLATPCDAFEGDVKEPNLTIQGTRGDI